MEAMDRFATELLGLSPWPKPSPEFQGEFGPYKVDSDLHLRLQRFWRGQKRPAALANEALGLPANEGCFAGDVVPQMHAAPHLGEWR